MKKILLLLLIKTSIFSCIKDDNDLCIKISDLNDRITILEKLTSNINIQITNIETIVSVMEDKDHIIRVDSIFNKNKKLVGHKVIFAKKDPIDLYFGNDGEDGANPVIGAKLFEGEYYWTIKINEEESYFMTDDNGDKIPTTGADGISLSPELKVLLNTDDPTDFMLYWAVSNDGGKTFEFIMSDGELLPATGSAGADGNNSGSSFFTDVEIKDSSVIFKTIDGLFEVPLILSNYKINIGDGSDLIYLSAEDNSISIKYSTNIAATNDYAIITAEIKTAGDDFDIVRSTRILPWSIKSISPPKEISETDWKAESIVTINCLPYTDATGILTITVVDKKTGNNLAVVSCPIKLTQAILTGFIIESSDTLYVNVKKAHALTFEKALANYQKDYSWTDASPNLFNLKITTSGEEYQFTPENLLEIKSFSPRKLYLDEVHGLNSLPAYAFDNSNLRTLVIPSTITEIPANIFERSILADINLENITTIGAKAFKDCGRLKNVNLKNVTTIGEYAFYSCIQINDVVLPKVKTIEDFTFYNCGSGRDSKGQGIRELDLPSVTTIGESAFYGCNRIIEINLPEVLTIGESAFEKCVYKDKYGNITSGGLNKVILPKATTIGKNAFYECGSLEGISLPQVKAIGENAFMFCIAIKSISFPLVETIGARAFYYCNFITELNFPATLKTLGIEAFMYKNMKTISINSENSHFGFIGDNTLYSKSGEIIYCPITTSGVFTIPSDITISSIHNNAFRDCTEITKVEGLNNVITIGDDAFRDCKGITKFTGLSNVKTIGKAAFYDCVKITEITNLDNVETIGYDVFNGCVAITKITGLSKVATIENRTFSGCISLTHLELPAVTSIGSKVFYECGIMHLKLDAFQYPNSNIFSGLSYAATLYVDKDRVEDFKDSSVKQQVKATTEYPTSTL